MRLIWALRGVTHKPDTGSKTGRAGSSALAFA